MSLSSSFPFPSIHFFLVLLVLVSPNLKSQSQSQSQSQSYQPDHGNDGNESNSNNSIWNEGKSTSTSFCEHLYPNVTTSIYYSDILPIFLNNYLLSSCVSPGYVQEL